MAYDFEKKLKDELDRLTGEQLAAVMHGEGGALCIAGPGSGKTRVISLRAARLWSLCGNLRDGAPRRGAVLTLSFNKPACEEMRSRGLEYIRRLGGPEKVKTAGFYTVHAYCFKIINGYCSKTGKPVPRMLDPSESSDMIEQIYFRLSGGRKLPADQMKSLKTFIFNENVEADFDFGGLDNELAIEIADSYVVTKREQGVIDFGDMLLLALKYLQSDPELRKEVRNAYAFTQVDEAQDLSSVQAEIVKLISNGNVLYVADDDQSIYGFRGANPSLVRSLRGGRKDFKTYRLEKNFRSGGDIVGVSSWFIKANDDRFSKRISAARKDDGSVSIRYFYDVKAQAEFCADTLIKRAAQGRSACVLYRNNASGLPVTAALYFAAARKGFAAGLRSFFGMKPKDSFEPCVRGVKMTFGELDYVGKIYEAIAKREKEYLEREGAVSSSPLPMAIYNRLKREKRIDVIAAECFGGRRPFLKEAVVSAVETVLAHAKTPDDFVKLTEKIDKFASGKGESPVNLSTVHSAKGLEYDTVIIIDCVEGEFPFGEPEKDEQIQEERRLMYVAMTRAENEVIITYPGRCGRTQLTASRFIEEIEGGS